MARGKTFLDELAPLHLCDRLGNMAQLVAPNAKEVILVVDGNETSRQHLSNALSRRGYQVLEYSSGDEALATLNRSSVDVVLIDPEESVMDGIELCRSIRGNMRFGRVPVVFITFYLVF